ncbi:MAG: hypothetical protein ABSD08_09290 [Xanthobacteraceae bacterium]
MKSTVGNWFVILDFCTFALLTTAGALPILVSMPTIRKITRLEAVRDQLDSAFKVYFLWDDLVSAITLAGAAERVMSDMQPKDGIFGIDAASIRSIINLYIKPEHQKVAATLYRADYDFFRHADKKTQSDYALKEEVADFWLFIALCSFEHLKQPKTKAMRTFSCWFFLKNSQYIKAEAVGYADFIRKLGATVQGMSKLEFYQAFCTADPAP